MASASFHMAIACFSISLFGCNTIGATGSTSATQSGVTSVSDESGTGTEATADETGLDEGENGSSEGEETGEPVLCPEAHDPLQPFPPPYVGCVLPAPCDPVNVVVQLNDDSDFEDLAAMACVLQSLAAGELAEHRFTVTDGLLYEEIVLRAYEGGRAERSEEGSTDFGVIAERAPHELDGAFDFSACGSQSGWWNQWDCLKVGLLDCEFWDSDAVLCGQ